MALSFIALGSNVAGRFQNPAAAVEAAVDALKANDINILLCSRLYRSAAWPNPADPEFVNAVVVAGTDLPPAALLARLHKIETEFGRIRRLANAPRTLDLDIVDYAGLISGEGESPILPHPRMADRAFVLLPLAEVAPDWRHPITGVAIDELISALVDPKSATPL